ncbi:MAG: CDP-diacylglycerol--glycerol-3-phosphate 3-phosphatidyltransferase [Bdellovibrio sp.]|nr:MAG: CDP-diacylglycerol--glycerol-3-phosphate 3-phosphatidyltransferase [Bdellovibrio sp.]
MSEIPEWKKHLPMAATYTRIILSPVLFGVLFAAPPWSTWVALGIFVLASLTDWLDGFWARRYHAESAMGKFMDPIADKILVLNALIILLWLKKVDPIMVSLLLSRDIFIGGIRSVAAANKVIIAAKPFGKWKTGLQMISIPLLFISPIFPVLDDIGYYGLWLSVLLSLISAIQYTYGYYSGQRKKRYGMD